MIYLDNAATSFPKPECVYQAVDDTLRNRGVNPGRGAYKAATELGKSLADARCSIANFFAIKNPRRVVFTYSATDSSNIALKGSLRPGEHVIASNAEHNAVVRPLSTLQREGTIEVSWVPCQKDGRVLPADIRAAMRPNTRMIAVTHASNVVGTIQPIEEIGQIAKQNNLLMLVDAAQTAGVLPIDVEAMHIHFLIFPGHKGLLGPQGIGGLYVHEEIQTDCWREGGTGSKSTSTKQPEEFPEHLEAGTGNTSGILGLKAGVEYIQQQGLQKIRNHERALLNELLQGLGGVKKLHIYGPQSSETTVATLSLNIEGFEPAEVGAILDQNFDIAVRTGLHCAPFIHQDIGSGATGTVRFSPGPFTTHAEIETAIAALQEICNS